MRADEELRNELQLVKGAVNQARVDDATAHNEGRAMPYSAEDIVELRRRVHEVASRARAAGVDISDMVGPNVGVGDFPG